MTFDKAFDSIVHGGKAKRKGWADWITSNSEGYFIFIHDVLADDWEVQ